MGRRLWEAAPRWPAGATGTTSGTSPPSAELTSQTSARAKQRESYDHWKQYVNIKTLFNFSRKCLPEFKVKNQTVTNCTKEPLSIDDVTRPCGLFMRELEFMKLWEEKKEIDRGDAKYYLMNIDDLSNKNESPIEIDIQQVKSREIHQYNRYIYI